MLHFRDYGFVHSLLVWIRVRDEFPSQHVQHPARKLFLELLLLCKMQREPKRKKKRKKKKERRNGYWQLFTPTFKDVAEKQPILSGH